MLNLISAEIVGEKAATTQRSRKQISEEISSM